MPVGMTKRSRKKFVGIPTMREMKRRARLGQPLKDGDDNGDSNSDDVSGTPQERKKYYYLSSSPSYVSDESIAKVEVRPRKSGIMVFKQNKPKPQSSHESANKCDPKMIPSVSTESETPQRLVSHAVSTPFHPNAGCHLQWDMSNINQSGDTLTNPPLEKPPKLILDQVEGHLEPPKCDENSGKIGRLFTDVVLRNVSVRIPAHEQLLAIGAGGSLLKEMAGVGAAPNVQIASVRSEKPRRKPLHSSRSRIRALRRSRKSTPYRLLTRQLARSVESMKRDIKNIKGVVGYSAVSLSKQPEAANADDSWNTQVRSLVADVSDEELRDVTKGPGADNLSVRQLIRTLVSPDSLKEIDANQDRGVHTCKSVQRLHFTGSSTQLPKSRNSLVTKVLPPPVGFDDSPIVGIEGSVDKPAERRAQDTSKSENDNRKRKCSSKLRKETKQSLPSEVSRMEACFVVCSNTLSAQPLSATGESEKRSSQLRAMNNLRKSKELVVSKQADEVPAAVGKAQQSRQSSPAPSLSKESRAKEVTLSPAIVTKPKPAPRSKLPRPQSKSSAEHSMRLRSDDVGRPSEANETNKMEAPTSATKERSSASRIKVLMQMRWNHGPPTDDDNVAVMPEMEQPADCEPPQSVGTVSPVFQAEPEVEILQRCCSTPKNKGRKSSIIGKKLELPGEQLLQNEISVDTVLESIEAVIRATDTQAKGKTLQSKKGKAKTSKRAIPVEEPEVAMVVAKGTREVSQPENNKVEKKSRRGANVRRESERMSQIFKYVPPANGPTTSRYGRTLKSTIDVREVMYITFDEPQTKRRKTDKGRGVKKPTTTTRKKTQKKQKTRDAGDMQVPEMLPLAEVSAPSSQEDNAERVPEVPVIPSELQEVPTVPEPETGKPARNGGNSPGNIQTTPISVAPRNSKTPSQLFDAVFASPDSPYTPIAIVEDPPVEQAQRANASPENDQEPCFLQGEAGIGARHINDFAPIYDTEDCAMFAGIGCVGVQHMKICIPVGRSVEGLRTNEVSLSGVVVGGTGKLQTNRTSLKLERTATFIVWKDKQFALVNTDEHALFEIIFVKHNVNWSRI